MANFELLQESVSDYLFDIADDTLVTEGATLEVNKVFKDFKKTYKSSIKYIKDAKRDGDYKKALKGCDMLRTVLKDVERDIDKVKDDSLSVVGGFLFESACSALKAFLIGIPTFGVGSFVSELKDLVDIIIGVAKQWKDEKEPTIEMFNLRRDKIKGLIKECELKIDKLENIIKDEENAKKEAKKVVKESTIDEIKLSIFESCHNGEITEEERDTLLSMM